MWYLFQILSYRFFFHCLGGNLDEATAKKAWELVKTTLSSSSPISRDLVESAKPKDLSTMNSRLVSEMDVEINGNAIVWICEGMMVATNKNDIITKKVGLEILSNLLKEPFYTEVSKIECILSILIAKNQTTNWIRSWKRLI